MHGPGENLGDAWGEGQFVGGLKSGRLKIKKNSIMKKEKGGD